LIPRRLRRIAPPPSQRGPLVRFVIKGGKAYRRPRHGQQHGPDRGDCAI